MKTKNNPRIRWIASHVEGCRGLKHTAEGTWSSPWWVKGDMFIGDSIGRNNGGYHQWFIVRCNITDCSAKMLVSVDDILEMLPTEK